MYRVWFIAMLTMLCINAAIAGGRFRVWLDHAQFLGADGQSYLELYYACPVNGIGYQQDEQKNFQGVVYFSLNIFQDDTLWATKQWKSPSQLADTIGLRQNKQHLVDLIRYPIQPGRRYEVYIWAKDYYGGAIDSARASFIARNFSASQPTISDLLIASSIKPFDQTSDPRFRKRAYDIIPKPDLTFGVDVHDLYYYFELYNMAAEFADSQYAVLWQVADSTGRVVGHNADVLDWRPITHKSTREIGQIGVWELADGNYTLSCFLQLRSNKPYKLITSKKFAVQKPPQVISSLQAISRVEQPTFLDGFSEAQLDQEYDQMFALTNKELRKIYESSSNIEQKRTQIYNLWSMNAAQLGLSTTEFRNRFLARIHEADQKYKTSFKRGWKTDQGIVFLKYGTPTDIERHPSEAGTKPYEIWRYENLEGGVIFVFIDRTGFNQYELVHSTKRGELSDPNWQRFISPNPLYRYE
ncbi:MAG: GWxTD domain-containing protein [candidate division KSB1 bacterium]|nr:GWxTD domain-containing protein [candidate division KSB1 bacterium]MDZ7357244.1 GWxTD domain-containing protein [candidate division KSB1 bacterium]